MPKQLYSGATNVARVYLIGGFNQRLLMRRIGGDLEHLGYYITSTWVKDNEPSNDATTAIRNIIDMANSDVALVVGPGDSRKVTYELAVARIMGIRLVSANIRKTGHLYESLPMEQYATLDEAMQAFRRISMFRFKRDKLGIIEEEDIE